MSLSSESGVRMTGILLFSHIYFFQKPSTYENLNVYVMYHSSVNKYSQINKTKTSNNNRIEIDFFRIS